MRLVEVANGDFAHTVVRLLLFSTARLAVFERLASHADPVLAAIAAKGVKELTYHRDYAGRWFVTLAQGTEESRRRLLAGLDARSGRCTTELLARPYDVGRARSTWCSSRSSRSARASTGPRSGAMSGRGAHRGAVPAARRDAGRRPRAPDGAVVSR